MLRARYLFPYLFVIFFSFLDSASSFYLAVCKFVRVIPFFLGFSNLGEKFFIIVLFSTNSELQIEILLIVPDPACTLEYYLYIIKPSSTI